MSKFECIPVSITFDDGRIIQYEKYFPILSNFGLEASFYVVTGWIGDPGFMGLNEICDLWKNCHEIGSHSHTHQRLSTLTDQALEFELVTSKDLLNRFACSTFAYPFGDYNNNVARKTMKYYSGARTYLYSLLGDFRYNFDLQKQRYDLGAFPIEHTIKSETASLISLSMPKFKKAIVRIVSNAVEKKNWTIFVFHGSRTFGLKYVARKICKHPLHVIQNLKNKGNLPKSGQIDDEIRKFKWMCEFLATNENIKVITVAKALECFESSSRNT